MALVKYNNVKISAISCCVPKNKLDNLNLEEYGSVDERKKYINTTNVRFRRIADEKTTSSDLCYQAASQLLQDNDIEPNDIDVLIFVTQTPDYFLPATSIVLQHQLGLPMSTVAFDVNLGCSGYVNGLNIAFSFLQNNAFKKVLLLCGDTISKITDLTDKTTGYLFGDAGSATLIESSEKTMSEVYFSLNSDGSDSSLLKTENGAFRNLDKKPSLYMDGMGIFNFTISKIPKDVKKLFDFSNTEIGAIDYVYYHQANKFINDFISKKLKLSSSQTPFSMYEYGNTSSASIPLTISNHFTNRIDEKIKVILSGFGVGLSWGHCILDLENVNISKIKEI